MKTSHWYVVGGLALLWWLTRKPSASVGTSVMQAGSGPISSTSYALATKEPTGGFGCGNP